MNRKWVELSVFSSYAGFLKSYPTIPNVADLNGRESTEKGGKSEAQITTCYRGIKPWIFIFPQPSSFLSST